MNLGQTASLSGAEPTRRFKELIRANLKCSEDVLPDLLSSVIAGIDFAAGRQTSHSGIFWALTRLVGCYERLGFLYGEYASSKNDALCYDAELEVEHFLIRLRVLIDEISYIIRSFMPKKVRGLSEPEGPGPLEFRQFRIRKFLRFVSANPNYSTALTNLIEKNRSAIDRFISRRDDIVHFRAKAIVIRTDRMMVGFVDRNLAKIRDTLPHEDLMQFVNPSLAWVWHFMQSDVVEYFGELIQEGTLDFSYFGIGPHRLRMPGARRLKLMLGI
jgi:hypothetical protein